MSTFKRNCDFCGNYYVGQGKNFCSRKCKNSFSVGKKLNLSEREIKRRIEFGRKRKGVKLTETHKKKIGKASLEMWKTPGFRKKASESRKGRTVSYETREKISKSQKGVKKPYVSEYNKTREKVSGWKHTEKTKELISQRSKGKNNGMYGKTPTFSKYEEYRNGEISLKMRSSWEVKFAKYLDSLNRDWVYEKHTFDLGDCTYTPDFFSEEVFYEVKGYMHKKAKEKIEKFKNMFPDKELILVDRKYMESIGLI